jgi:FkbM family methyltransferase
MIRLFKLLFLILPRHPYIYRCCKKYCNQYLGENHGDMRENGELFFVRSQAAEAVNFFDVGANEGEWSEAVSLISPEAPVFAFEPSASIHSRLRARGLPKKVQIFNHGLSDQPEQRQLIVEGYSLYNREGCSTVDQSNPTLETVSLITLDEFCLEKGVQEIGLLKIDVEGHELSVLRGAKELLEGHRIRMIYFEYNKSFIDSRILLKDIFSLFNGKSYQCFKLLPDRLVRIRAYDQMLENFEYKHFAFVRTDVPLHCPVVEEG